MGLALLSAERSKDPSTQVGACIVSPEVIVKGIRVRGTKVQGLGYNGFPNGISDDDFSWEREGSLRNTKYPYVCHAELNAVCNSTEDLTGSTIYVTLFPCSNCAKLLIQKGIAKVVYYCDKYASTEDTLASKDLFEKAGVEVVEYKPMGRRITLDL